MSEAPQTPQPEWTALCHEAAALFEKGQHREAIERFEAIVAMDGMVPSDKSMMYVNLATAHMADKNPRRALDAYDKAAELVVDYYAFVELHRANGLFNMQRFDDCIETTERVLTLRGLSRDRRNSAEELLRHARRGAVET